MAETEQKDSMLVEECLKGNTEAFGLLVEKYQKPIFNVALRMVNDYDDAQDITQSVFVKAFEKLDAFNPKYKFFSWIYKMTVNESVNFLNQRKRFSELDRETVSSEKTPEEHYLNDELSAKIQDAIMDLQTDYRVAIVLRHFADLSYREIGYILDLAEKTVKSRLFTARRLLYDILKKRGVIDLD
jgi:RNA polymerase sigma-70 factor (ECF subfamily)